MTNNHHDKAVEAASEHQQAAVLAGAKALADDWNPDRDPVLTAMFSDYSATALTAATPHLRAGVAEEVRAQAEKIRVAQLATHKGYLPLNIVALLGGYEQVAALLEGGGE